VDPKELIVVGGPNGAGKTTFVEAYLRRKKIPYLCADAIAKELSPSNPESVAIEAGRQFIVRIANQLHRESSFIVESTLSGKTLRRNIETALNSGFSITIHFVFTNSPDTSVERVAARVKAGGHHVAEADIRRRFQRSLHNFWTIYRPLAGLWVLAYNGGVRPVAVANGGSNSISVHDEELLERFFQLAGIHFNDSPNASD
jgi:predicted ABC-type ATPase